MEFDDWPETIAWLVAQRKDKGLSIRAISELTGIPTTTVWRMETQRRAPSYVLALKYIHALGFRLAILEPLPLE